MPTRVINVREAEPYTYIYVGRYMPGLYRGHPLANPFKLPRKATEADRSACLERYREWLLSLPDWRQQIDALAARVQATGLPLGCWCAPKACHADVLAELIDAEMTR